MTKEQQEMQFRLFTETQSKIILSKREDYAGEDVLSNFKLAGNICGISPARQCLSLIATKVARLSQLLDWNKPNNESIEDSIKDLTIYGFLLNCLMKENETPNN